MTLDLHRTAEGHGSFLAGPGERGFRTPASRSLQSFANAFRFALTEGPTGAAAAQSFGGQGFAREAAPCPPLPEAKRLTK